MKEVEVRLSRLIVHDVEGDKSGLLGPVTVVVARAHECDDLVRMVPERTRKLAEHLAKDEGTLLGQDTAGTSQSEQFRPLDVELQHVYRAAEPRDRVVQSNSRAGHAIQSNWTGRRS